MSQLRKNPYFTVLEALHQRVAAEGLRMNVVRSPLAASCRAVCCRTDDVPTDELTNFAWTEVRSGRR